MQVDNGRRELNGGWTLASLTKLVVDSVTAFSYKPIRAMSYFGAVIAMLGFIYAIIVIFAALIGDPPTGWASLMVMVLILGGIQMLMLGVLGEYLWRALDEARSRPPFVIEASTGRLPGITEQSSKSSDPPPANPENRAPD